MYNYPEKRELTDRQRRDFALIQKIREMELSIIRKSQLYGILVHKNEYTDGLASTIDAMMTRMKELTDELNYQNNGFQPQ